jgi:hypothetical protein
VNGFDIRHLIAHRASFLLINLAACLLLATAPAAAQTNLVSATNRSAAFTNNDARIAQARMLDVRAEQVRTACIQGRRVICGKVLQILPNGLVVESGYTRLMNPPFNKSWRISGTVSVSRDAGAVELNTAGTPCIGLVFLTNYPKRPAVKLYDYVSILGYPAGPYTYVPVPTVKKTIRRFAASLENAVNLNMAPMETENPALRAEAK